MLTADVVGRLRDLRDHMYRRADASVYQHFAPVINAMLWDCGYPPDRADLPEMTEMEWINAWRTPKLEI